MMRIITKFDALGNKLKIKLYEYFFKTCVFLLLILNKFIYKSEDY